MCSPRTTSYGYWAYGALVLGHGGPAVLVLVAEDEVAVLHGGLDVADGVVAQELMLLDQLAEIRELHGHRIVSRLVAQLLELASGRLLGLEIGDLLALFFGEKFTDLCERFLAFSLHGTRTSLCRFLNWSTDSSWWDDPWSGLASFKF